jgi:hypothetical protein
MSEILPLMFIAALFTRTKIWNLPNCPTTHEWLKKTYLNGILFSHKKHGILSLVTMCMDLEKIMLNEISQAQKDK